MRQQEQWQDLQGLRRHGEPGQSPLQRNGKKAHGGVGQGVLAQHRALVNIQQQAKQES